ncbi:MAG: leucine-rich repeat protein [Clostridia bacterium]|nr:leucine-rich repeat protein [Clostridia bacterium]
MKVFIKALPVLLFLVCFLLLTAPAYAITEGDWSYEYIEGGARIIAYNGSDTVLTIPSRLGGQTVVALREQLFYYDPDEYPQGAPITSVTVPAGVTTVGSAAFYNCQALESVTFQSTSALSLGEGAFLYCSSLETVHFTGTASVSLDKYVFSDCTMLTTFDAPSVIEVGELAFKNCNQLQSVSLAANAVVGEQAFIKCSSLTSVGDQPVTVVGDNAFALCSSLESVSFSVPSSGLTLGNNYFKDCSALQTVAFVGNGTVRIGINCFSGCNSLISVSGAGIAEVGSQAFYGLSSLESVSLSDGASVGQAAFMNCPKLSSVGSGTISSIGSYAFAQCPMLSSVSLSASEISEYTFYGCSSLNSFTSAPFSSVGKSAFSGCTLLPAVTLTNGAAVGEWAFKDCGSLTSIGSNTIGAIDANAFNGCSSLMSASVSASEIPEQAFCYCASLTQITLQNVQTIGAHAFDGCSSLTSPVFPSTLTQIGTAAFQNCGSIQSLIIPTGVISIGDGAFYNCAALSSVSLSEPLTSIGQHAFGGSNRLAEIDIPDTVTTFGEDPFERSTILIVGQGTQAQAFAGANGYSIRIRGSAAMVEVGLGAVTSQEKVDAIVAYYINDGMSDYDKALILHDYLITFADYDTTAADKYQPEGVLLHGGGVCQSYTLAYQMLLNAVGITNDTETGTDHIWNMVLLGGNWYHIDCTWDDPTGGGNENHDFFCVTDYVLDGFDSHERFNGAHHATSLEMNYLFLTGGLETRINAISNLAANLFTAGETTGSITSSPFGGKYHIVADRLAVEYWQGKTVTKNGEKGVLRLDYTSTPMTDTSSTNDFAVTLTLVRISDLGSIRVDPGRSFTLGICEGKAFEYSMSPASIITVDANGVLTAVKAGTTALTVTGEEHIYTLEIKVSVLNTFTLPASLTLLEEDALCGVPAQLVVAPAGMTAPGSSFFSSLDSLCLLVLQGSAPIPDPSVLPAGVLVLYPDGVSPVNADYIWGHSVN